MKTIAGIGLLLCAVFAPAAQAQYSCRTAAGTTFFSDRPCSSSGAATVSTPASARNSSSGSTSGGVRYYGPSESSSRYQPPPPGIGEAPPHIRYMSPRCSSLHDALRTASARGLKHETVSSMRKGYQAECAEDERDAYAAMSRERGEKMQERRAEMSADKAARDRSALRDQQCGESKRILVTKKARTDLTEGERAELQRFEDNYRARCT